MRFESADDANLYLSDSTVKYNGRPVTVHHVARGMKAKVVDLLSSSVLDVAVSALDFSPFPLGYVFIEEEGRSLFIQRMPTRSWRIGITGDNLFEKRRGRMHKLGLRLNGGMLKQMLCHNHYSLADAHIRAKEMRTNIPFHPNFAVDLGGNIFYKTLRIGAYRDGKIQVAPAYAWLNHTIKELQ